MEELTFRIQVADSTHKVYANQIAAEMEDSAKARGTGIAKRSPSYLEAKMDGSV